MLASVDVKITKKDNNTTVKLVSFHFGKKLEQEGSHVSTPLCLPVGRQGYGALLARGQAN